MTILSLQRKLEPIYPLEGVLRQDGCRQDYTEGGFPKREGRKNNVVANTTIKPIKSNRPMLAVPGCADSARLAKEVAVVSALKITARVVGVCKGSGIPLRQLTTK